jgi:hypothetical protein
MKVKEIRDLINNIDDDRVVLISDSEGETLSLPNSVSIEIVYTENLEMMEPVTLTERSFRKPSSTEALVIWTH